MNKNILRRNLIDKRANLDDEILKINSEQIAKHICDHPDFLASQTIAFYFAQNGEADPKVIMETALSQNRTCFLPVLKDSHLTFAQYQQGDKLKNNRFCIREPVNKQEFDPDILDLACVPLVVFDHTGNRIGMGGGFYDRTFARKLKYPENKPILIGIAHSFQQYDHIEAEAWDVPLNYVVTEKGIIMG